MSYNDETSNQEDEIEIDLGNLTKEQVSSLKILLVVFIVEIVLLIGNKFITDLFKIFISESYREIADYASTFFSTLIPILFVIFLFLFIYQAYIILINNEKAVKDFADTFNLLIYILVLIPNLVIIVGSMNLPTYVEFLIFVFIIILLLFFYFLPTNRFYTMTQKKSKKQNDQNNPQ